MKDESINKSNMPYVLIDGKYLYNYEQLGYGAEGLVFKLDGKHVFKVFDNIPRILLKKKFDKIEELSKIKDESFCFPIGLIGYTNRLKEGYYTDMVSLNEEHKDFKDLYYKIQILKDIRIALKYIKLGDIAIKRIHKKGVILGDINGSNIMIDSEDNVKFVDTDSYSYEDFDFDFDFPKIHYLERLYKKTFSKIDNDKYLYALLSMHLLYPDELFYYKQSDEFFKAFIQTMSIENHLKDGLRQIFSDSDNKPYITDILNEIEVEDLEYVRQK